MILKNFYNSKSNSFYNKECSAKHFGESKNGLSKSIEPMGSMKSCRQKTFIIFTIPKHMNMFQTQPVSKAEDRKRLSK